MTIDDKSASHEDMAARPCPICGSADESHVYSDAHFDLARLDEFAFASRKIPEYMHYRLITCPVCDLLYASPAPGLEALARSVPTTPASTAARRLATPAALTPGTSPRSSASFPTKTEQSTSAPEMVRSSASYSPLASPDVAGVEPSAAPISSAQDDVRELIRHDIFRPDLFEPGRYSLITCFQTMEHVHDPIELARGAYSRLKKGGAAFFIGHNRRGLVNRLLGRKSPIFDIEHLQLFSPKSARALFERTGFVNVEVHRIVNRYPLQYWTKLLPIPKSIKVACLAALKRTGIGRLPLPMAVGNIAVIGYK